MFATAGARSESGRSPNLSSEAEPVRLIDSPLVAETADWLGGKTKELGSLLSSDRAVEYAAILRAFSEFRRHHEPEPLHEDSVRAVCGEMEDPFAELTLKNDLRQLKDWGLVTERIEKERLRGYRDNRRTKFRYRLCEEAVQFIDWLAERRIVRWMRAAATSPEIFSIFNVRCCTNFGASSAWSRRRGRMPILPAMPSIVSNSCASPSMRLHGRCKP